jgi:hypothetical protein
MAQHAAPRRMTPPWGPHVIRLQRIPQDDRAKSGISDFSFRKLY